ncbi:MAG: hypothetical protein ABI627_21610 [Polyangiaceae bacterium]
MTTVDECVIEVVRRGLDDWVQAAEVVSVAQSIGGQTTSAATQRVALEVIGELLRSGLMQAGGVTKDGFSEWSMSWDEAFEKIASEWEGLGRLPNLGELCWLSNTSKGDQLAQSVR